jgi:hypothetical protein
MRARRWVLWQLWAGCAASQYEFRVQGTTTDKDAMVRTMRSMIYMPINKRPFTLMGMYCPPGTLRNIGTGIHPNKDNPEIFDVDLTFLYRPHHRTVYLTPRTKGRGFNFQVFDFYRSSDYNPFAPPFKQTEAECRAFAPTGVPELPVLRMKTT